MVLDYLELKDFIDKSGLKQKASAEKSGVPEVQLCLILQGKRKCEVGEYASICNLLISRDNSETSLDGQRRCLSAFFTWMRKLHLITENPCDEIEPYKIVEKPIDHMQPEEVEQLKTGCRTKRDRAMIEFLRSTAVRVGEAAQIRICDIDWRTGEVCIYISTICFCFPHQCRNMLILFHQR